MERPSNSAETEPFVLYDCANRWEMTFPNTPEIWKIVEAAYTARGRHYHGLAHIQACLDERLETVGLLDNHGAVIAAIWFHDIVYDATRSDNEAASADMAERLLREMGQGAGFDETETTSFFATVRELIMDTRHAATPASLDGQYLVDIDLAILGQTPEKFDAYERAIRLEYAHVPEEAFRKGRAGVLRKFLERPAIYHTAMFREKYEAAARENIERSIARLRGSEHDAVE